jgi:hypothetical protein
MKLAHTVPAEYNCVISLVKKMNMAPFNVLGSDICERPATRHSAAEVSEPAARIAQMTVSLENKQ